MEEQGGARRYPKEAESELEAAKREPINTVFLGVRVFPNHLFYYIRTDFGDFHTSQKIALKMYAKMVFESDKSESLATRIHSNWALGYPNSYFGSGLGIGSWKMEAGIWKLNPGMWK